MELTNIEKALREGCKVRAFLSGGGLRVIRIEDAEHELKGYGEHPHAEEALQHADDDYAAGGREYSDVYGGTEPHYLTGSTTTVGELDAWVRTGSTFHAVTEGDGFVFVLDGYDENINQITKTGHGTTLWEAQLAAFAAEPCPKKKRQTA
jgi:hypothetical protein